MHIGWSGADVPDLTGKVAVVTGANRGLGREITRALAGRGARVIMACRDMAAGEAAAAGLAGLPGPLEVRALDLADLASVETFAAGLAGEDRLDILGHNAGLMAVDRGLTADGFETHIGVNHLGPFALTARLLPLVRRTAGARVVTMSSFGARIGRMDLTDLNWERRPYDRWRAYMQSKLANLLFTFELDRRLRAAPAPPGAPAAALCAHPGGARTSLGKNGHSWGNRIVVPLYQPFLQPASIGAQGFVRAATDPAAAGGACFGPAAMVWGPPVRERPPRRGRDPQVAAGLWVLSEQLTGVSAAIG
ncbi:MAG TPA: oxidoreductase [Acidimicrobiia bacterium]|nr:oxidoreductase [Acidimicrobiia bacterium]